MSFTTVFGDIGRAFTGKKKDKKNKVSREVAGLQDAFTRGDELLSTVVGGKALRQRSNKPGHQSEPVAPARQTNQLRPEAHRETRNTNPFLDSESEKEDITLLGAAANTNHSSEDDDEIAMLMETVREQTIQKAAADSGGARPKVIAQHNPPPLPPRPDNPVMRSAPTRPTLQNNRPDREVKGGSDRPNLRTNTNQTAPQGHATFTKEIIPMKVPSRLQERNESMRKVSGENIGDFSEIEVKPLRRVLEFMDGEGEDDEAAEEMLIDIGQRSTKPKPKSTSISRDTERKVQLRMHSEMDELSKSAHGVTLKPTRSTPVAPPTHQNSEEAQRSPPKRPPKHHSTPYMDSEQPSPSQLFHTALSQGESTPSSLIVEVDNSEPEEENELQGKTRSSCYTNKPSAKKLHTQHTPEEAKNTHKKILRFEETEHKAKSRHHSMKGTPAKEQVVDAVNEDSPLESSDLSDTSDGECEYYEPSDISNSECEEAEEDRQREKRIQHKKKTAPSGDPSDSDPDGSDNSDKPRRRKQHDEQRTKRGAKKGKSQRKQESSSDEEDNQGRNKKMSRTKKVKREPTPAQPVNIPAFHGRIPDLEKFTNTYLDKTNFNEFLDRFFLNCKGLGIHSSYLPRILPMYFTDGALLVYKTLIEKKPGIADDWERLTKELTKSFGNRSAIPANELSNVVKHNDETTSAFYNRVRTLAAQVYPNQDERGLDDIIRTHFISGLDQATQVFFMGRDRPVTAHEAYLLAERRENSRRRVRKKGTVGAIMLTEEEQQTMHAQQVQAQADLNRREISAQQKKQENRSAAQPPHNQVGNHHQQSNPQYNGGNSYNNRNLGASRYNSPGQNYNGPRRPPQNQPQAHWRRNNGNDPRQKYYQNQQQRPQYSQQQRPQYPQRNQQQRAETQMVEMIERPWRGEYTTQGIPICSWCGYKGHIENACRTKARQLSQQQQPAQTNNRGRRVQYEGEQYDDGLFTLCDAKDITAMKQKGWSFSVSSVMVLRGIICLLMAALVSTLITSSVSAKQTYPTPMICPVSHREGVKSHLLLSLPEPQACTHFETETKSAVQPLNFQFYHSRSLTKQDRGYLCYKKITTIRTFLYFLQEERLHKTYETLEALSANECWEMVNNQRIDGHNLFLRDGVISTHLDTTPKYTWCCRWVEHKVANYFLEIGFLYLNRESGLIKTSLGNAQSCEYTAGECTLGRHGVIVWHVNETSVCWYEEWDFIEGEYHSSHWMSKSKEFSLTFLQNKNTSYSICDGKGGNVTVWKSDQGALVKPDRQLNDTFLPQIVAPVRISNMSHNHVHAARIMVDLMTQALAGAIQKENAKVFWQGIQALCHHNQLATRMFAHLITLEPTRIVRSLLNDSYLTAKYSGGNLVSVQSCFAVDDYNFTKEADGLCGPRVPLRYSLQDRQYDGYLDPLTNIVYKNTLKHHCKAHESILLSIKQTTLEYKFATGTAEIVLDASHVLTQRLTQNFTYQESPLIIFRDDSGLIPLADESDEQFLNDFIQTLATERDLLRSFGATDNDGDVEGGILVSTKSWGILGWLRRTWDTILRWWSVVVNSLVTFVFITAFIQTVRHVISSSVKKGHRRTTAERTEDVELQELGQTQGDVSVIQGFEVYPVNSMNARENTPLNMATYTDTYLNLNFKTGL